MKTYKVIFMAFATMILGAFVITSCSNEESNINELSHTAFRIGDNINSDLQTFTDNHIIISNEIIELIEQNENVVFSSFPSENLDEDGLKSYLEDSGIENSFFVIEAMKRQLENFRSSLALNDNFINLSIEDQENLIIESINNNFNITALGRDCHEQWDVDIQRCNRNYALNGGAALVLTFATGGLGLVGVAAAVAQYNFCLSDALSDFEACREAEINN